jgi:DNA-directed RNA polymerase specialized sigma24 family protein
VVAGNHLHVVPSPATPQSHDEACLDALQRELDYIHRSLRRLGTEASEVEDLAQEVFLACAIVVPMRDVALALSIPPFTAYSRLRKARKELDAAVRRLIKEGGSP